jgi:hypothetical protein
LSFFGATYAATGRAKLLFSKAKGIRKVARQELVRLSSGKLRDPVLTTISDPCSLSALSPRKPPGLLEQLCSDT